MYNPLENVPNLYSITAGLPDEILFYLYPDIHASYQLAQQLKGIFENTKDKIYAYTKLAMWHETVNNTGFKAFNSIARTIQNHYKTILNYFDN